MFVDLNWFFPSDCPNSSLFHPLLNHPLHSASVRFITNFSAVEFLLFYPSCFLSFVFTARIISVRLASRLVSSQPFGFYLSLRKKNDAQKGKKIVVLNPFVFPYLRRRHLHTVPVFYSSILVCVICISYCLILLYRSNVSRDVCLSLLYCAGHRYVHGNCPPPQSLSAHPRDPFPTAKLYSKNKTWMPQRGQK